MHAANVPDLFSTFLMSNERQPPNFRIHIVPPIIDPVTDEPTLAGADTSWTEREFPRLAQMLHARAERVLAGEPTYEISTDEGIIEKTVHCATADACLKLQVSRFVLIRNKTDGGESQYVTYFTNGQGVSHRLYLEAREETPTLVSHAISPLPELEGALEALIAQDMDRIIPAEELANPASYNILAKDAPSQIRFVATRANELIQRTLHPIDNIPTRRGRSWGQID